MPSTSGPRTLSGGTGITMNQALVRSMRENLAQELSTRLNADLVALNLWLDTQELILLCLDKDPRNRPSDALAMTARLEEPSNIGEWSSEDAEKRGD